MLALEHHIDTLGAGVGLVQPQYAAWDEPLLLDNGVAFGPITLAYETYGTLNTARDNAVLVLHALSGDAHVAGRHQIGDRKPGWWDALVGPGRALDTAHYFVMCANVLGGCQGSTGPSSIDPTTDRPYGMRFPRVSIGDMVRAQMRLLDRLGIQTLHAAIGGSMGGMQVLDLVINHPHRVRQAILLATTARHSAQQVAWNHIGREAIMRDPNWRSGDYYAGPPPADGLAVARMIGHVTYLSEERLERRFGRDLQEPDGTQFAVESYLNYQGNGFVKRFDANSYIYITDALDRFDASAGYYSVVDALSSAQARFFVASFDSDWLYPPRDSEELIRALDAAGRDWDYVRLPSILGHDAFLLEHEQLTPIIADVLASV